MASALLASDKAFARGAAGRAGSSDPLCNSPKMSGARLAGCNAILAQMTSANSCTKPIFDRITTALSHGKFRDMEKFCPNYSQFKDNQTTRNLIWRNVIAGLVAEESTWNPNSTDGGQGLLQMSVADARRYKCGCAEAIHNIHSASANAKCGTHIFFYNVAKDMRMGGGPAGRRGAYGAARFFGPFGDGQSHKRARIASKVTQYCRSLPPPAAPRQAPAPAPAATQVISQNTSGSGGADALRERPLLIPPSQNARSARRSDGLYPTGFMMSLDN